MAKSIEEMIRSTKEKYSLDNYFLKNYDIERDVNIYNQTIYKLTMEWIPNEYKDETNEQLNPPGTAIIELDLPSEKTNTILFVHEQNKVKENLLNGNKLEDIIAFIETETKLEYEKDFLFQGKRGDDYIFQACYKSIPLYPEGYIEVKLNDQGKLVHFITLGQFLGNKTVEDQAFAVKKTNMIEQLKQTVKLIQLPDDENQRFEKLYGIEETFITNDEKKLIPYQLLNHEKPILYLNKVMRWDVPEEWTEDLEEYEEDNIDLELDIITYEQVLAEEPSADVLIFQELKESKIIETTKDFLYKFDPFDSNMWTLTEVYVDNERIHVNLQLTVDELGLEKILIFIDPESYEVINYFSNEEVIHMYMLYEEAEEERITREEAYKLLKQHITIKPYYVYDRDRDKYILCGKIDSKHGVHASSGQLVIFNE